MSTTTDFLLIFVYGLFVCQIFVISVYLPSKWRRYRKALFDQHSEEEYPNLYYQPLEVELRRLQVRKILDYSIAGLGLLVVGAGFVDGLSRPEVSYRMVVFALVQFIPFLVSRYWGMKNSQKMTIFGTSEIRRASMVARIPSDFISYSLLVLATFFFAASLGMSIYMYFLTTSAMSSWQVLSLMVVNILVNIYVSKQVFDTLYSRRKDQYLSEIDRSRQISKTIRQSISGSILFSLFVMVISLTKMFSFDLTFIFITTSVYVQFVFIIWVNPKMERDFKVYQTTK